MIVHEHLTIDNENRTVYFDGEPVRMLPAEYDILYYLASNANSVISADQIIENLWPGGEITVAFVRNTITMIRRKVEKDPRRPELIDTVYGKGYKFCSYVKKAPQTGDSEVVTTKMMVHNHLAIDPQNQAVYVYGKPVKMLPAEYEILFYLVNNANHVVSTNKIIEDIWPEDGGNAASVGGTMTRIRRKVEENPRRPKLIRTVYGKGYKFCSRIEQAEE